MSASFPFSIAPILSPRPSRSAAAGPEEASAAAGLMPSETISANSSAEVPCGETPASVPNAIFTPDFSARRNVSERAAIAARALAAISGGIER
jgi:hypothetical protein